MRPDPFGAVVAPIQQTGCIPSDLGGCANADEAHLAKYHTPPVDVKYLTLPPKEAPPDAELVALGICVAVLEPLGGDDDDDARRVRIIRYLSERYL